MENMSFSERVKVLRESQRLNRVQFSEYLETPTATIDGIETKGRSPRLELIQKIVNRFPSFCFWLVSGKDEPVYQTSDNMSPAQYHFSN